MLTFIYYLKVYFTFAFLGCVHYNEDLVKSRFLISRFCFIHFIVSFFSVSNEKVDRGEAVQKKRKEADLDGEVENEMKKITYYFYCIHSDCTVYVITEDFLYCV